MTDQPHTTADGTPCPQPHWLYWGGIGATCKHCGRVEIDGELSGFEQTQTQLEQAKTP